MAIALRIASSRCRLTIPLLGVLVAWPLQVRALDEPAQASAVQTAAADRSTSAPGKSGTATESADEAFSSIRAELAHGHDELTAPLVRLTPGGALVRLDGLSRLAGAVTRVATSATYGQALAPGITAQISAGLQSHAAPNAPDLAFRMISLDPMATLPLAGGSISLGPSYQKIDIASRPFRQRYATHLDWTGGKDDGGYISYIVEHGHNQHAAGFEDFDARSTLALVRRQFSKPLPGLTDIAVEAGVSRESNQRAVSSLSHRLAYTRVSAEWSAWSLRFALTWMHHRSRFDAPESPALPARRDRFDLGELAAVLPLTPTISVRLDALVASNRANSEAFQSRQRSLMLGVVFNR